MYIPDFLENIYKLDFNKNFIIWLNNHKRLNDKRRKRIKRGGK